jgi:hypothetical protein
MFFANWPIYFKGIVTKASRELPAPILMIGQGIPIKQLQGCEK